MEMFVNPMHKDLTDEKDTAAENLQILDPESSVASEKLLEITEKSVEASYIDELPSQNFNNQYFDPNQSSLNQSNISNSINVGRQPADRGRSRKNQALEEEARTSGGHLLHHIRQERESEREGLKKENVKDLIKKYENQSNKENRAKSEPPKQIEPRESIKDLIKKFETGKAKQTENNGENRLRLHSEERESSKGGVVSEMIQKFQKDIEARESAKQRELQQAEALRKLAAEQRNKIENRLLDDSVQKEEIESSIDDKSHNIADNPFPILSAEKQKESEEQFRGDLRETANFDALVNKDDNSNKQPHTNDQIQFNPFHITPSNEHENLLRPSGDFGFHKTHQNYHSGMSPNRQLNEIEENPAEYRNSALDDAEHKFPKQMNNVEEESESSRSYQQEERENRWKYDFPQGGYYQMGGGFDKNTRMIGIEHVLDEDTEHTKDYTQVAFKNTFFKKDQDQSVSMNVSKIKEYSMISQGRDQSLILRAADDTNAKNGGGQLKLLDLNDIQQGKPKSLVTVSQTPSNNLTNTKMNEANIISAMNTGSQPSRSQDSQKQHSLDDSNVFNKIDKVLKDGNLLDELNESQKQIIQDIDEEQKQNAIRLLSERVNKESTPTKETMINTEIPPNKNSNNYSPLPERISAISRGGERKSLLPDQGEENAYLTQGDIDFFNKFLDISAIPQFNEHDLELEAERFHSPNDPNQKAIKPSSGSKIPAFQAHPENEVQQDRGGPNRSGSESPEAKNSQGRKKREFKIQQVEGLQYEPAVMKEQLSQPHGMDQKAEVLPIQQESGQKKGSESENSQIRLNKSAEVQVAHRTEANVNQHQEANIQKDTKNASSQSAQVKPQGQNESTQPRATLGLTAIDRNKIRNEIREKMNDIEKELQRRREGLNNLPPLGSYKRPQMEEPKIFQKTASNSRDKPEATTTNKSFDKTSTQQRSAQDEAKKFVENFFAKNYDRGELFKTDKKSTDNSPHVRSNNESYVSNQSNQSNQESNKYYFEPRGTESGTVTSKTKPFTNPITVEPFRETLTLSSHTPVVQQVKHADEGQSEKLRDSISQSHAQRLSLSADLLQQRKQQEQNRPNLNSSAGNVSYANSEDSHTGKTTQSQYIKAETPKRSSPIEEGNWLKGQPYAYSATQGRDTVGSSVGRETIESNPRFSSNPSSQYPDSNRPSEGNAFLHPNQIQIVKTTSMGSNEYTAQHQQQNIPNRDQPQRITENYSLSNTVTTNTKPAPQTQITTAIPHGKGPEQVTSSSMKPNIRANETPKSKPHEPQSIKTASKADLSALDTSNVNEASTSEGTLRPRVVPITQTKANRPKFASAGLPRVVFGYKVKEDIAYRPIEERKINKDVFCMNCEEFIAIEQVDTHSQNCVKKAEDHQQHRKKGIFDNPEFKQSDQAKIEDLNQKIERIIVKLNDALRSVRHGKLRVEFVDAVKRLVKVARDIVAEDFNPQIVHKKMKEFDQIFGPLSSAAKGQEIGVLIYLQRMFVALQHKADEFRVEAHNSNILQLQEQLEIYERETLRRKAELELWQYQSEMLQDIQRNDARNMKYLRNELKRDVEVISQIQSEIESSGDRSEDTVGTTESEFPYTVSRVQSKGTQADREALRRYFYTEAVNIKLTLPLNHPCRDLLISDLYDQCVAQNVPKEDYVKFIRRNYNLV